MNTTPVTNAVDRPRLTASYLKRMGACADQVARFQAEWPDGAEITPANVLRAYKIGLNVDWIVCNCLNNDARLAYEKAVARARLPYYEAVDTTIRACDEAVSSTSQTYNEAVAAARRATRSQAEGAPIVAGSAGCGAARGLPSGSCQSVTAGMSSMTTCWPAAIRTSAPCSLCWPDSRSALSSPAGWRRLGCALGTRKHYAPYTQSQSSSPTTRQTTWNPSVRQARCCAPVASLTAAIVCAAMFWPGIRETP